jgi:hypothetical protein
MAALSSSVLGDADTAPLTRFGRPAAAGSNGDRLTRLAVFGSIFTPEL